jgi:hypothetical protein
VPTIQAQEQYEVVSDDEFEGDDDLNVIVATMVIEDKMKEAGMNTVAPLLKIDVNEETKEETKESEKPRL